MASTHVVAQGEHLSSIADVYGFTDYSVIWNDSNNAELRQRRMNPNVLQAGDTLYIPDKQEKVESGSTTQRHVFKLDRSQLMLRLVIEDAYEKPLASAPCTLFLGQDKFSLTCDGEGKLEKPIAPSIAAGVVIIEDNDTAFQGEQLRITIGALDPIDSLSGQAARLNNLGYSAGMPAAAEDAQFESAVQEFQCDHSLTVDGDCGPQTQAKLKQVYGC